MSDQYLGQIEIFGFGYAPRNWAICAGQMLSIQQNTALFALLGTTFGGNGTTTFALPDMRSRLAMGQGNGQGLTPRIMGESGGEENHTLLLTETPSHSHQLNVISNPNTASNTQTPSSTVRLSQTTAKVGTTTPALNLYAAGTPNQAMASASIGTIGGQPHPNIQPYLALNYCIAMSGIFPSRN